MSAETHRATILIVDDTPINLRVIVESLEGQGYQIVVATRGEEALKRANYVKPDLILLDVMMPDLNGFEICRRLKAEQNTAQIPIVMLTALSDEEHQRKGRECGAADYITKPFDPDVLLAAIKDNAAGNGH